MENQKEKSLEQTGIPKNSKKLGMNKKKSNW